MFSLLLMTAAVLVGGAEIIGEGLGDRLHMGDELQDLLGVLAWPLSVLLVVAAVALLYWLGPAGETEFKWVTPGAAVFAVGWLLASFGFALYVANIGSYNSAMAPWVSSSSCSSGCTGRTSPAGGSAGQLYRSADQGRADGGHRVSRRKPRLSPSLRETSSQLAFASFSGKDGTGGVVCAFNDECWKGRRVCRPFLAFGGGDQRMGSE